MIPAKRRILNLTETIPKFKRLEFKTFNELEIPHILKYSTSDRWLLEGVGGNTIITCAHLAYAHHLPLSLDINDFWLAFLQGLSIHIASLVDAAQITEISTEISAHINGLFRFENPNVWGNAIHQFFLKAEPYLNLDSKLLLPKFGGQSYLYQHAYQGAVLGTLNGKVNYKAKGRCGLEQLVVGGSKHEWMDFRKRVMEIAGIFSINIRWWTDNLVVMINGLIRCLDGVILPRDLKWWKNFYYEKDGQVFGHILKLFPYLNFVEDSLVRNTFTFNQGMNFNQFPPSKSEMIVKCYRRTKIVEKEIKISSGFLGCTQDPVGLEIKPIVGFIVSE